MTSAKEPKVTSEIAKYDLERLSQFANVGMKGVDPLDIQPPRILLMAGLSKLNDFTTADGSHPEVGDFFHTGLNLVMKDFVCHFLAATKGKWYDKRKEETFDQYSAIGAFGSNLSLFGMNFRVSSLYALSALFTAAKTQNRPMFSFVCKVETKELSGKKGTWSVPVVRVVGPETDGGVLARLEEMALRFDARPIAPQVAEDEVGVDDPGPLPWEGHSAPQEDEDDAPPPTSENNDGIPW